MTPCPACRAENRDAAKFCGECGKPVTKPPSPPPRPASPYSDKRLLALIAVCAVGGALLPKLATRRPEAIPAAIDFKETPSAPPSLTPAASGIVIRRRTSDGSRSLAYTAKANEGAIRWTRKAPERKKPEPEAPVKVIVSRDENSPATKWLLSELDSLPKTCGGRPATWSPSKARSYAGAMERARGLLDGGRGPEARREFEHADLICSTPQTQEALRRTAIFETRARSTRAIGQLRFANASEASSSTDNSLQSFCKQELDSFRIDRVIGDRKACEWHSCRARINGRLVREGAQVGERSIVKRVALGSVSVLCLRSKEAAKTAAFRTVSRYTKNLSIDGIVEAREIPVGR